MTETLIYQDQSIQSDFIKKVKPIVDITKGKPIGFGKWTHRFEIEMHEFKPKVFYGTLKELTKLRYQLLRMQNGLMK